MGFLENLSDIIICAGAVAGAIAAIYKLFSGPTTFLRKKQQRRFQAQVKEALDEVLPTNLGSISLAIKQSVLAEIKEPLEEIKKLNIDQNELLAILNNSLKDVLRERIMTIYNAYKRSKCLPLQKKEILEELYKDYKEQKGNTYIDKYKARMDTWEVVDNEIFDELED